MSVRKIKKVPSKKYLLKNCRICGSKNLYYFLNLGYMPIPNGFLFRNELTKPESYYPLQVCVCESCFLMQLRHVVPAEIMFKNYLYIPSTSLTHIESFDVVAADMIKRFHVRKGSLAVDIGSNDGTLLLQFKASGMKILGIDPAENLASEANRKGIRTLQDYFTTKLAGEIVKKYGRAKLITATNVIGHINDLHDLCDGLYVLLDKTGVFMMRVPYVIDLLDKNEFDTIYHEHLSYFSFRPLLTLFSRHRLKVIDVQKDEIHGGSIRVYVTRDDSVRPVHPRVEKFVTEEKLKKLHLKSTYDEFARRVKTIKRDFVGFLKRIREQKKMIIGYGASAKGNVLLNYSGITTDILAYLVDSTPYKQGKYTPGTHIPIYSESKLEKDTPDYALLLSWNFASEIIGKQRSYRERGGQFIITIPYLRIV